MSVCLSIWWQLFWEKKLSGLNAFDIAEELVKTMDLPKGLQGTLAPRVDGGTLFLKPWTSGAAAWFLISISFPDCAPGPVDGL